MFQPRTYRQTTSHPGLIGFRVCVAETDLQIAADRDLSALALSAVKAARGAIETAIVRDPRFLTSLEPLPTPKGATGIVRRMYRATERAGVGPMAAVAGAVAQVVGEVVLSKSEQVIVENGGDIFLQTKTARVIGVQAGPSPLSGHFGLSIPGGSRLGVCTSSATVGHSLSLGKADAGMIICEDAALADAFATTLANQVQTPADVQGAIDWARTVPEIKAALVIIGETLGVCGEYDLVPV
ncbi:MAG: UPF0280 family protein [Armatimonadota bacterium]